MNDEAVVESSLRRSQIVRAHRFFEESATEWAEVNGDPEKVKARLNALTVALRQYLRVVVIDLEPGDNAQVIFETLNHRGTPLLAADLVKNLLFRRAESEGLDVEELYSAHWADFDSDRWRKIVRQGRLKRPRIDVFLNYWLAMRKAHEVPADRIFTDFSDYLRLSDAGLSDVVKDMTFHADVFDRLEQQDPHSVPGTFAYRVLEVMDQGALMPLLLHMFGRAEITESSAQLERALTALESWAVRRMICRWTQKGVNRLVIDLLELLKASPDEDMGEVVESFLLRRTGEAGAWPTDEDVSKSLLASPLYKSITRARLRMILEAMEDQKRSPKTEEQHCTRRKLTIEHIMPQGWREHWGLPGQEHPEVEAARRDALIQTIGNLTLVTDRLNPAMSNRPWTDMESRERGLGERGKRSMLNEHSVLLLNREVIESHPETWTESDIESRSVLFADRIVELWTRPVAAPSLDV